MTLDEPLAQILILLAVSVFVVALTRRLGLPSILGYLITGLALGPHAFALVPESSTTSLLAEFGVVFLLFTLGLEFSLPRMMAMRREVFGLGAAQVGTVAAAVALVARGLGVAWLPAIVTGGAIAMSSTAIILHQLTDRAELNRTHGRLAFSMLLFQDLAFVPFLALAAASEVGGSAFSLADAALAIGGGAIAIVVVLAAGHWLLRPLLHEMAHSRLRELFTLAVLLVVLGSAWVSHLAGLSLALGGFLSGMMLGETEYRHQIEAVIRPFRDILLGLFFISIGMLLDVHLLIDKFATVSTLLIGFVLLKGVLITIVTRCFVDSTFKALRTAVVMSIGGEFGLALLSLQLQDRSFAPELAQPLLAAVVLSMLLSPVIVNNNKRIARFVLRQDGPPGTALEREVAATGSIAQREHVILCGFGRVGQSVGRVLESQGFEYIAVDLDPARIRAARRAGDPVIYGDSSDEEMLNLAGVATASAVVVSFSNPGVALAIVKSVRLIRSDVPVLVRTQDDARLDELRAAGATEVVPETFETSMMLVSQVLMLLQMPIEKVVNLMGEIRSARYSLLRSVVRTDNRQLIEADPAVGEEVRSVVLPPRAWAVGRSIAEVQARGALITVTGVRRQGILGRDPSPDMHLQQGDIVVMYGLPDALEHAESVLLAG